MKGFVSFAGYCVSGNHNVSFMKDCDVARDILKMKVPRLPCSSCGAAYDLSPEAVEEIRRQLDSPDCGATA